MKFKNIIRCIHRHTIEEHPHCFINNEIIDLRKDKNDPWWVESGYNMAYIDIETDNLEANFGTMLSWCLKAKDGDIVSSVVTKQELFDGTIDKRVVKELVLALQRIPITIGYYSSRFDMPFIRSKALYYLARDDNFPEFPSFGKVFHWDLYFTVRSKLSLSRNSLAMATAYLNIPGKTPLSPEVWTKAKYGDKEALDCVLEHNREDVKITEKLHNKLVPFRKWIKTSV